MSTARTIVTAVRMTPLEAAQLDALRGPMSRSRYLRQLLRQATEPVRALPDPPKPVVRSVPLPATGCRHCDCVTFDPQPGRIMRCGCGHPRIDHK